MDDYTNLLRRQIRRYLNLDPQIMNSCRAFLDAVNSSYMHYERDYRLTQASLKISSQELNEQAQTLAERTVRLNAMLQAIKEGIIVITDEGEVELYNDSVLVMLGVKSAEELHQQKWKQIKCCIEIGSGRCNPYLLSSVLKRARLGEGFSFCFCHNNKTFFNISASSVVLSNRKLNIYILRDISKQYYEQEKRKKLQEELIVIARRAGMMQVASSVLHNVGNVLNSVNVTVSILLEKFKHSEMHLIVKVAELLREHELDRVDYIQTEQGKILLDLIIQLANYWKQEVAMVYEEAHGLIKNIEHIKNVIKLQQSMSGALGVQGIVFIPQVLDDLINMHAADLATYHIEVTKECEGAVEIYIDRSRLVQILVNLLRNAIDSVKQISDRERKLTFRLRQDGRILSISIIDNGVGIPKENLTKIFSFGFTSKEGGHGFGLHASACLAHEMHGKLQVSSAGVGQGACFTLTLPYEQKEQR